MKTLITLFVLFFSSSVVADDISDFQIEGISLYESLLSHTSKENIKSRIAPYPYKTNEYMTIVFDNNNLEIFDSIEITFKSDDPTFKILAITGLIFYDNENEKCRKQKSKVLSEIEHLFKSENIILDNVEKMHAFDKTGNSLISKSVFDFIESDDFVSLECYDWGPEIESQYPNWSDNFRINIISDIFNSYLRDVEYN